MIPGLGNTPVMGLLRSAGNVDPSALIIAPETVGVTIAGTGLNTTVYAQASVAQVIPVSAAAYVGSPLPTDFIISTAVQELFLSDVNVTASSGKATAWGDMTANGRNRSTPGGTGKQATINSGGPASRQYLSLDGVDDFFFNAYTPPSTGFVVFWFRRIQNDATPRFLMNGSTTGTGRASIRCATTDVINMANSTNANQVAIAANTWTALYADFTGTTSDSLQVASNTPGTTQNAGTNGSNGGLWIGCTGVLASFLGCDLLGWMRTAAKPNSSEMTQLRGFATSYWNGAVAA